MQKPTEDLPALFRSLGPDDANFQATETAAAREAEQRWPLFRAVAPKKSAPTPALSPQERQCWSEQEPVEGNAQKPALSLPGLSNKMALGLGKMSGRTGDAPARGVAKRREPASLPETRAVNDRVVQQQTATDARSELFPRSHSLDPVREAPVPVPVPVQASGSGIFAALEDDVLVAIPSVPESAPADDSLAKVFSRLEEKPEIAHKPVDKKPSFLNRLGKR